MKDESCSHIEELINRSSENLNESQKESMTFLLHEYKDHFSRSPHNLGCTGLTEHTIRTIQDCIPVKKRPYIIPLAKREVAEREIKLMAEKGLIEPFYSPPPPPTHTHPGVPQVFWCQNLMKQPSSVSTTDGLKK